MDQPPEDVTPGAHRPRDLALLLLAASGEPPRARARDQQADRAGEALWRRILDRIAALDPDPDTLETALAEIVAAIGPPDGPTRALGAQFLREWDDCRRSPGAWSWLLGEAIGAAYREPRRGPGRADP